MSWKNLSIGRKIGLGFGVVLVLLGVVGVWSVVGIGGIVTNAGEVIEGNKLRGVIVQREVDHLNWASKVNQLLTDEKVTELKVQTDPSLCAFGEWYHSSDRRRAEKLVPELHDLLKAIEAPHDQLHRSAEEIKKVFRPANPKLPVQLAESEVDHLKWAAKVRMALMTKQDKLGVETDPTKCRLGQWLASDEAKQIYKNADAEFRKTWDELMAIHERLHHSAIDVEKDLAFQKLADLKAQVRAAMQKWDAQSTSFRALLKTAMDDVIDPARSKAGKSGDAAEIARWAAIDTELNEGLLQPLAYTQLEAERLLGAEGEADWSAFDAAFEKLQAGITAWSKLAEDNAELTKVAGAAKQLYTSWAETAAKLRGILDEQRKVRAGIAKAEDQFENTTRPLLTDALAKLEELRDHALDELRGLEQADAIYATKTRPALEQVQKLLGQIVESTQENVMTDEQMLAAAQTTRLATSILSVIAVVAGIVLAIVIARGISRPVIQATDVAEHMAKGDFTRRLNVDRGDEIGKLAGAMDAISETMSDLLGEVRGSVDQVASGAGQIADASQSLSQGASEQASALEEISSSMTQMASQTKQNAENAGQANQLSTAAKEAAEKGNQQMSQMVEAMSAIEEASASISKIIKVIDEIAFQTNLLALNAAVEAARAGKHGKGFAVVAEEVRSLAARSAKAADETTALIESSVEKVKAGTAFSSQTAEALNEIFTGVSKATDLVAEIAAASSEQAQGIGQVNQGLGQLEQVTQQNTANAEEGAAASEELSSQADQLKELVARFKVSSSRASSALAAVGSASGGGSSSTPSRTPATSSRKTAEHEPVPAVNGDDPSPEIRLDDSEFGKF